MIKRLNESGRNEEMNNELMEEAFSALYDCLNNGYSGYYCDIHNEVFNTHDYTDSEDEAVSILERYGVFSAIGEIIKFEKDEFGNTYTDVTNPKNVMNMLWYIKGEDILPEMYKIDAFNDNWDYEATPELNEEIMQGMKDLGYVK